MPSPSFRHLEKNTAPQGAISALSGFGWSIPNEVNPKQFCQSLYCFAWECPAGLVGADVFDFYVWPVHLWETHWIVNAVFFSVTCGMSYDNFMSLSHFSHLDQCWHNGAVLIKQQCIWMKENNLYLSAIIKVMYRVKTAKHTSDALHHST